MYGSFARPSRGEMDRLREMRAKKFTTCSSVTVIGFAMGDGTRTRKQVLGLEPSHDSSKQRAER